MTVNLVNESMSFDRKVDDMIKYIYRFSFISKFMDHDGKNLLYL